LRAFMLRHINNSPPPRNHFLQDAPPSAIRAPFVKKGNHS
jgi:hypothetical protein